MDIHAHLIAVLFGRGCLDFLPLVWVVAAIAVLAVVAGAVLLRAALEWGMPGEAEIGEFGENRRNVVTGVMVVSASMTILIVGYLGGAQGYFSGTATAGWILALRVGFFSSGILLGGSALARLLMMPAPPPSQGPDTLPLGDDNLMELGAMTGVENYSLRPRWGWFSNDLPGGGLNWRPRPGVNLDAVMVGAGVVMVLVGALFLGQGSGCG